MPAFEYTMRPSLPITLACSGAVIAGAIFGLSDFGWPLLVVTAVFGVLLVVAVLPYYLWRHRLIVAEDHVVLPGHGWSRRATRVTYAALSHISGTFSAGDTSFRFADEQGREHTIDVDLLPSPDAAERVVSTLLNRIAAARHAQEG